MSNYFKLCGDGLGRPIDCYPFNSGDERLAAFAAVLMAKEAIVGPASRRARIVLWKYSPSHPDLRVVGYGYVPPEPGWCETDEELDRIYPPLRAN